MKFSEYVIDALLKNSVLEQRNCIQNITFAPPAPYQEYDCSIRVDNAQAQKLKKKTTVNCELFESIDYIGNYINIKFDFQNICNALVHHICDNSSYAMFETKYSGKTIGIEHTSITPVYPINLATFRSSVVGEALKNLLVFLGAKVETHFFVEDLARQLELLNKGLVLFGRSDLVLSDDEKIDHVFGAAFASAYLVTHPSSPVREKIGSMFPLSCNMVMDQNDINMPPELSSGLRKKLCEVCLDGVKKTLLDAGVYINFFDYESDYISNYDYSAFKEPEILQNLIDHSLKIPYYLRNCAYFANMAKQYDLFFTVISDRQRSAINETLDSLNDVSKIATVFFGDVLITDDDEKNALDSIKEGVFHSVDQYIDVMSQLYSLSANDMIRALKFKILSTKTIKGCYIDDLSESQYEDFTRLESLVSTLKNNCDKVNGEPAKLSFNPELTDIVKRMMVFEDVLPRVLGEYNFSYLTDYLIGLCSDFEKISSVNKSVLISSGLGAALLKIFEIGYIVLDI